MKKNKKEKTNYNETIQNIKKMWPYLKGQKKDLIVFLIANILICIISIIVPAITAKQILNLTNNLIIQALQVSIVVFVIEIFRNITNYFSRKATRTIYVKTVMGLQFKLSEESTKLKTGCIDSMTSGTIIKRISDDPYYISNIFSSIATTFLEIVTSVGVLITIFIINKIIFMYIVCFIAIRYYFESVRLKKVYEYEKERRVINETTTGLISELIRGNKDIKALNISRPFTDNLKVKITKAGEKRIQMENVARFYSLVTGSIHDISDLGFAIVAALQIINNMLTIPNTIVLMNYRSTAERFLYYLVNLNEQIKQFNVSATRIFEVIDSSKFEKETFGNVHLGKIEGNFEFKNVSFSYNNKITVLNNMSFKIRPNETVAFVGKSGGGKTTVFSLLNKLYTVKKGKILIEGVDINKLDRDSIRDNMSIITQNPYIFNMTIKDNLKLVKTNATMKEIKEACRIACLDEYIESLPKKYNTLVGEGGVTLSGGQRQRLAIARALLKQTEIILFDEATSALDNETQSQIQEAIRNMKGEYTILIIAHRLSTVVDADRILVVENGRIVAEGTQKELMKTSETFKELYSKELEE